MRSHSATYCERGPRRRAAGQESRERPGVFRQVEQVIIMVFISHHSQRCLHTASHLMLTVTPQGRYHYPTLQMEKLRFGEGFGATLQGHTNVEL